MPANMNHYDAAVRICVDQVTDGRISERAVAAACCARFPFRTSAGFCSNWRKCWTPRIFPRLLSAPGPSAPNGERGAPLWPQKI